MNLIFGAHLMKAPTALVALGAVVGNHFLRNYFESDCCDVMRKSYCCAEAFPSEALF